ncbi:hypothetical protein M404DRAFT_20127 [Pisolithus tinctorius Marx 270]|uniref:Uncharacterized protein n=1 Tax=Pisolithus tinctorius Marx 270 TaxID=870435 RepID=A0A0C3PU59_PISTI|nr:hypothetical protein M404DRAFT_20127 [Pisolithus tinctorius Marx 270]
MPYTSPTEELKEMVWRGLEQYPQQQSDEEGQKMYVTQLAAWTQWYAQGSASDAVPMVMEAGTAQPWKGTHQD